MTRAELIEKLAALEHERWASWQKHLHDTSIRNLVGTITLRRKDVERWDRQIETPYENLTEHEKELDRAEVRKYLAVIQEHILMGGEL